MEASSDRILCYGGSFNPIHNGHLLCAQAVAEAAGFSRVLLIPSGQPPHRARQNDMATARDRLTMCQLAVRNSALFDVSDIELRLDGPSYTVQTARALKQQRLSIVNWLIGSDTVPRLATWYDFPRLMEEIQFVVVARPGAEMMWDNLDVALQPLRQNVVRAPLVEISASDVRDRVRHGRSIDYHVPAAVASYIAERGLYREPSV
ncbi:nicotinate (nicotinamide) nucleotide adenylyltransferase [Humisphaera borealis]|uniref:Probable nicotinate-nucleotide adenylyltransferase n=1 Tax=Humisphaera borealis TaxID=2807512 RepID=A0A7M2WQY8_9BACT|nr:nicotinate (nicotinamide) nucleotide adenylyltransferase [Humisphaera borealis]QOV87829.1 nicotinate (nicotinamide) nucleotide adenylyltransferase [Humisphaera borealis]